MNTSKNNYELILNRTYSSLIPPNIFRMLDDDTRVNWSPPGIDFGDMDCQKPITHGRNPIAQVLRAPVPASETPTDTLELLLERIIEILKTLGESQDKIALHEINQKRQHTSLADVCSFGLAVLHGSISQQEYATLMKRLELLT
jgi:hypothetical protein